MTSGDDRLITLVTRLPREIEPPSDLWPAIAARLTHDEAAAASLARRLAPDVDPGVDLWPAIVARLDRPSTAGGPARSRTTRPWFAIAASLASLTIMASLMAVLLGKVERLPATVGLELGWLGPDVAALPVGAAPIGDAIATIRAAHAKVQGERLAIEESLQRDGDNMTLHALWLHAYQTELGLAGKAEQLIEGYQGV